MLVGRQDGGADQQRPDYCRRQCPAGKGAAVKVQKNDRRRDVQGRRLVEWHVERGQEIEQESEFAGRLRPRERDAQREDDEAGDGDDLGGQQPLGMVVELGAVAADIEGQGKKNVRAPVRDDRPSQERNAVFPGEYQRWHVTPLTGEPV